MCKCIYLHPSSFFFSAGDLAPYFHCLSNAVGEVGCHCFCHAVSRLFSALIWDLKGTLTLKV